jgi:hypothetical protein
MAINSEQFFRKFVQPEFEKKTGMDAIRLKNGSDPEMGRRITGCNIDGTQRFPGKKPNTTRG